jgi:hypothetical protein
MLAPTPFVPASLRVFKEGYVGDLVGEGVIQLTLIGVVAGFAAKKVLARTFYTLQGMSIDSPRYQRSMGDRGWSGSRSVTRSRHNDHRLQ